MEIVGNKAVLPSLNRLPRLKQPSSLIGPKPIFEKTNENHASMKASNENDVVCSPLPPLVQAKNVPSNPPENLKINHGNSEIVTELNAKKNIIKVTTRRESENFNRRVSRVIKPESSNGPNKTIVDTSLGPLKPKTALKSVDLNEIGKIPAKIQEVKSEKNEQIVEVCESLEVKKKKKKKILTQLKDMVPLNLNEEKKTFFNLNGNYNPVFQYNKMEDLTQKFSQAHTKYLRIAERILQECIKEFGDDENYIEVAGGNVSTQAEIEASFAEYVKELELEKYLKLTFSDKIVSSACCLYKWKGKGVIVISLPITHRDKRILSVLDHEIGTHFVRKFNERKQPWAQNRDNYSLKNCLLIEEGLAMLNQTLGEAEDLAAKPYLFSAALHYYACYKASVLSFKDLYQDLEKYIKDPTKRWKECIRVKRGIVETEKPGGMYKDQVYLRGSIKILQNRKNIDFIQLHAGKLNLEDLHRMNKGGVIKTDKMKIPKFLKDMDKYKACLDRIASFNFIDTL